METNFKNIMIISNTRDNLGSHVAFAKDVNDIKDTDIKEMILNCLNSVEFESNDLWSCDDMCGSDRGYIFNDLTLSTDKLPVTIEHIINYVF